MRRSTLRTAVAVVTAGLTLTACGGSDDGGSGGGSGCGGRRHRDVGRGLRWDGRAGRGRQGGGHAQRHRAAPGTGRTTARCSTTFSEKYDIEINSASPDGSSQDELNAVESQKGQDRAPDVLDLGTAFARQAQAQDLVAPYQVETWDEIPEDQKDPDGHWVNDYGGYISIGCNATVIAECPASFAELLDPQYAGPGRAQRQPDPGRGGVQRRLGGVPRQRRQPGRHRPGHRLLRAGQGRRQLQPGRDHPGHDPER